MTPDLLEAIDTIIKMMKPADELMKDIDEIFDAMLGGGFYSNDKR